MSKYDCGNCEFLCKEGYKSNPPFCEKYFPVSFEKIGDKIKPLPMISDKTVLVLRGKHKGIKLKVVTENGRYYWAKDRIGSDMVVIPKYFCRRVRNEV